MIFANPAYGNTHNTDKPPVGSPYESVRKVWDNIGHYNYDTIHKQFYCPIGTRLLVSVGHIGSWVGMPIDIQGLTVHVIEVNHSPSGFDLDYCVVDTDIPVVFSRLTNQTYTNNNNILVIGGGLGTDGYFVDAEGWPAFLHGDDPGTIAQRWGINKADLIGSYNPYPPNPVQEPPPAGSTFGALFKHHDAPDAHPETVCCQAWDSGSPAFLDCGSPSDPWVYIGSVGGGGHNYLSPYKGAVQTAYGGGSTLFDNDYIDFLNGVGPEPEPEPEPDGPQFPEPPPVADHSADSRPIRGELVNISSFTGPSIPADLIQSANSVATWLPVNGALRVSGYSNVLFNDRVEWAHIITADENWVHQVDLKVITPLNVNATTGSAWIGMNSLNALKPMSLYAGVAFSGGDSGELSICIPGTGTITPLAKVLGRSISIGATLRLTLRRSRSVLVFSVSNLTNGTIANATFRYPEVYSSRNLAASMVPPNTGRPAIATGGGVWDIISTKFISNTRTSPDVAVIGDSVSLGLTGGVLGGPSKRWTDYLVESGKTVAVYAGGFDGFDQAAIRLNEVITCGPGQVILACGSEDILSQNRTVTDANIQLGMIKGSLEAVGLPVKVLTPLPCNYPDSGKTAMLKALRDLIVSEYPDAAIDVYSIFADAQGGMTYLPQNDPGMFGGGVPLSDDRRHPNAFGHRVMGNFVGGFLT